MSSTLVAVEIVGRLHRLSDGTTPCGRELEGLCVRGCHFQSQRGCTKQFCGYFFIATTARWLSPLSEPLPEILTPDRIGAILTSQLEVVKWQERSRSGRCGTARFIPRINAWDESRGMLICGNNRLKF